MENDASRVRLLSDQRIQRAESHRREDESQGACRLPAFGAALSEQHVQNAGARKRNWIIVRPLRDIDGGLVPQSPERVVAEATWSPCPMGLGVDRRTSRSVPASVHQHGRDHVVRNRHRNHLSSGISPEFCDRWHLNSLDFECDTLSIEQFKPMVGEAFAQVACEPLIIREGFTSRLTGSNA